MEVADANISEVDTDATVFVETDTEVVEIETTEFEVVGDTFEVEVVEVADIILTITVESVVSDGNPEAPIVVSEVVGSIEVSSNNETLAMAPVFIDDVPVVSFEGIAEVSSSFENCD